MSAPDLLLIAMAVVGIIVAVVVAVRFPKLRWPMFSFAGALLILAGAKAIGAALHDRVERERSKAETIRRLEGARRGRLEVAKNAQTDLDTLRAREAETLEDGQGDRERVRKAGRRPTDVGT